MKTPHPMPLMLAMMLLTSSVIAQEVAQSSDPPGLSILQKRWYKEVLHHPGRNLNPLAPNEEYMRLVRAQKAVIRRRDESLPNQTTEDRMPVSTGPPLSAKMARSITYVYKIKGKNTGSKTIKAIFWEYEFLDPETQEVMGRRRIASRGKFSPGKSYKLERRFDYTPPTRLVAADKLDRKYRDQFIERVIIHRIHYADGSAWQRAQ